MLLLDVIPPPHGKGILAWAISDNGDEFFDLLSVFPAKCTGYYFVTRVVDGMAEGDLRGGPAEMIIDRAKMLGFNTEGNLHVVLIDATPSAHNPLLEPVSSSSADPYLLPDVYFIQAENGAIKVGIAYHPQARLETLQTGSPLRLTLIGVIPNGGQALESEIHRRFSSDGLHGEWFHPSTVLFEFINHYRIL